MITTKIEGHQEHDTKVVCDTWDCWNNIGPTRLSRAKFIHKTIIGVAPKRVARPSLIVTLKSAVGKRQTAKPKLVTRIQKIMGLKLLSKLKFIGTTKLITRSDEIARNHLWQQLRLQRLYWSRDWKRWLEPRLWWPAHRWSQGDCGTPQDWGT